MNTFISAKKIYDSTIIKTELPYVSITNLIIYTLIICCINMQYACITDNINKSSNIQSHIDGKSPSLIY